MSREQERIRRKLENNPAMECNKIRNRYCPDLFHDFADTKDPRNPSYTKYSNDELLGTMFYKGIAGIESIQMMTYEFNRERVVENLYRFMERKEKEYLPHAVTVNEYFEKLDPEELQKVQQKQVYGLIRSKVFYDARYQNYHCDVPEAKIVRGESLVVSIGRKRWKIENEGFNRQKN